MGSKKAKRGPGRPPHGPESRPLTFCVKLSKAELAASKAAAAAKGIPVRVWLRELGLRAARRKG